MPLKQTVFALLPLMTALAAGPLPELRTEAVTAGSIFHVRNAAGQPLTAYLIELVGYPGSSYWLFQDDVAAPIAPGAEERIPVTNMTVGAAPEYVKITAALYSDGSSAGSPEKVALIIERRKSTLETAQEAVRRLRQAQQSGTAKADVVAGLKQWADSLQPQERGNRMTPANVNKAAARSVVSSAAEYLKQHSIEETLAQLQSTESAIHSRKP